MALFKFSLESWLYSERDIKSPFLIHGKEIICMLPFGVLITSVFSSLATCTFSISRVENISKVVAGPGTFGES